MAQSRPKLTAQCDACGRVVRVNSKWLRLYSHAISLTSTETCPGGGTYVAPEHLLTGADDIELERARSRTIAAEVVRVISGNRRSPRPVPTSTFPRGDEKSVSVRARRGGLPGLGKGQ